MAITWRTVALLALGLVPVLLVPSVVTAWAWVALVVIAAVTDVLLAPRPAHMATTRGPVAPTRLGEETATTLTVRNDARRRARGLLRDAWQPSAGATGERHRLDLPSGAAAELTTMLRPRRRGDLRADRVTIRTLGPLGLAGRQGSLTVPGTVRVLPDFPSRRHLPGLLAELRLLDGRSAMRTRGQGTEFDSLRDYVPGDDVRSIDWRATARRGDPVVRTWRPERDRQIVVVLDTSRTSAGRIGDVPRLDAAMDAALLLTALATRAGDRVDLVAGDRDVRVVSPGGRGAGREDRLHQVVDLLAPLDPSLLEADWPRLAATVLGLTRGRALVVLLTTLDPVVVEETLLPALDALGARHRVVVASVQDPGLTRMAELDTDVPAGDDSARFVYEAAAAEQTLARRRRTAEVLAGLGVTVLDRPPSHLPLDLCRTYLALKGRGRL